MQRASEHMDISAAQTAAGRLNWATMIYPLMRPFLQPLFAWVTALLERREQQAWGKVKARPTATVALVAGWLLRFFNHLPPPQRPTQGSTPTIAASSAGARPVADHMEAYVGGWYSPPEAAKHAVSWSCIQILPSMHPWTYASDNPASPKAAGSPQHKIAALELYATALLYKQILKADPPSRAQVALKLATDNRGNAHQVTNHKAKNHRAAAMLMEISIMQHLSGTVLGLRHTYREQNLLADQLTHADFEGLDIQKWIHPDQHDWHILHNLIKISTHWDKPQPIPPPRNRAC